MLAVQHCVAAAVALVQVSLTGTAQSQRATNDSDRTLRTVRSAQIGFESFRRYRLPISPRTSGACDITIGRYCYWRDDESDAAPPAEPEAIRARRSELIRTLDSAASRYPGDEWIAGQTVRYLVEAARIDDALRFTARCRASAAWCNALRGYAAHEGGRFALADSAYAAALAAMPEPERCRWLDQSDVLADDLAARYNTLSCDARESFMRRAAFIGAPLYLVSGTDLFTEQLARVSRARMAERSANPYGLSWASDQRALVVRYGWPAWYTRTLPDAMSQTEPSIVGHDAGMAYYFLPSARGVEHPAQIEAGDWNLDDVHAPSGYTPAYARTIHALTAQIAAFRRGESTLVVASWDARRDTTLVGRDVVSALALATPERVVAMAVDSAHRARGVASVTGVIDSGLVSVELLAREDRRAARRRVGIVPPGSAAPGAVTISDLLLYAPGSTSASRLAEVRDSALAGGDLPRSRVVGVFWETYGLPPAGAPMHFTLSIQRVGVSWFRRAAERLGIADAASTLRIQWEELPQPGPDGISGRGLSVDLSRLRSGRFEMRLVASRRGAPAVTAVREILVP